MPVLTEDTLRQTVAEIFTPLGATDEEVARLQDHLVGANLRGHDSHGVRMCPTYVELWRKGDIVFGAELEVVRESPAHAVLDAHKGLGQRMAWHAANMAIEKAGAGALAAVTLRHCSHIGRLGEYAEQIAAAGLIGFVTVNGQGGAQLVAPWGGVERRLSVNPFAWGIPAPGRDIMVDISPTVVAGGKVNVKQLRDEPLPVGWVMDSEGRDTTDAADFNAGSLLPIGGHKGFALGIVRGRARGRAERRRHQPGGSAGLGQRHPHHGHQPRGLRRPAGLRDRGERPAGLYPQQPPAPRLQRNPHPGRTRGPRI